MVKQNGIYKCSICGNVVSVIEAHNPAIICCGKEMDLLEEKTSEQEGEEKHVPVIEIEGNKITVKVGSVPHPMEDGHYIELIQILKDGNVIAAKRLNPGEKPEKTFFLENVEGISARELCNIHGLWKSE